MYKNNMRGFVYINIEDIVNFLNNTQNLYKIEPIKGKGAIVPECNTNGAIL